MQNQNFIITQICISYLVILLGNHSLCAQSHIPIISPEAIAINQAGVDVAANAIKSVVSITASGKNSNKRLAYFQEYLKKFGKQFDIEKYESKTLGSGVIINSQGYIITNNHVVDDIYENEILVELPNKDVYYAQLIGRDHSTDLALLRIFGEPFASSEFGNSDSIKVGAIVFAVGNPLGLNSTVTSGIVSALNREVEELDNYKKQIVTYIQTDAAINPGNSGGGLYDIRGYLIGINTAILTNTGYSQGYGFAVPSSIAKSVAMDLQDNGRRDQGYIGITVDEVSDTLAEMLNLPRKSGVLIENVELYGPSAGKLFKYDVIMKVNNKEIYNIQELKVALFSLRPEHSVLMEVWRSDSITSVEVMLSKKENDSIIVNTPFASFGALLKQISATELTNSAIDRKSALQIISIKPHSTAAKAKLMIGDIILEFNNKPYDTVEDLEKIIESHKAGEKGEFIVKRQGKTIICTTVLQPLLK